MPELPEVENLRLGLEKYLIGKTIHEIDIRDSKLFDGSPDEVIGAKFVKVRRYAKGLVMDLSNGNSIAVHIKLTGQLIFRDDATRDLLVEKPTPATVPNDFTRVVFDLDNNSNLYFQEVRGFAWMKVIKTENLKDIPFFKALGPEPFPSEGTETPKLTFELFEKIVTSSNLPIKPLLMEQKKIGGIGNIYANDSCWDARIDPRRPAKTLTHEEIKTLYESIFKVLEMGIKYKGSSELNYVDVLGKKGEYQNHALVYGRVRKECRREDGTIKKIYLGGRGTFFCPACQS